MPEIPDPDSDFGQRVREVVDRAVGRADYDALTNPPDSGDAGDDVDGVVDRALRRLHER